jgi:hypothetical protein
MNSMDIIVNGDIVAIKDELRKIDLNSFGEYISDFQYCGYFLKDYGVEHYKLLAYISNAYADQTIYDIGTHYGNSSVALSVNPSTKVISYDIEPMRRLSKIPENCDYRIGDFTKNPNIINAPFIFIDVDPHDGIQEKNFHEFFINIGYKGLVLWDDIHLSPQMQGWWDSVTESNVKKVDLTDVGHHSGTGLLIYS